MDPGVTAELECLLDDVLTGRQAMTGAVDAVCNSARRIIGRLESRPADDVAGALGDTDGLESERPPTASMRKFAASIARRKGIKPPAGYTRSAALCGKFLDEHAPRRTEARNAEPAAGDEPVVSSGDAKSRQADRARSGKAAKQRGAGSRRTRGTKQAEGGPPAAQASGGTATPLRIPYGNKETAFSMGARYGAKGWYAPPGVDLSGFRRRGWL